MDIKKEAIISVKNLRKDFSAGKKTIEVLRGINLDIYPEDFAVIFGPSGCGKSTLLNIVLGIDTPSSGQIMVKNEDISKLNDDQRSRFRVSKIGMVYQMPYWLRTLNVQENVAIPLIMKGIKNDSAMRRSGEMLAELGIEDLKHQIPTELSGGEQQRAGLARALITNPEIILADEPTGNLDSKAADDIMRLLFNLNKDSERTVVLVTHNDDYWNFGNRRVEMKDGMIVKDTKHEENCDGIAKK